METGGDGEEGYKGNGGGDQGGVTIILKRSAGNDATHCASLSILADDKRCVEDASLDYRDREVNDEKRKTMLSGEDRRPDSYIFKTIMPASTILGTYFLGLGQLSYRLPNGG